MYYCFVLLGTVDQILAREHQVTFIAAKSIAILSNSISGGAIILITHARDVAYRNKGKVYSLTVPPPCLLSEANAKSSIPRVSIVYPEVSNLHSLLILHGNLLGPGKTDSIVAEVVDRVVPAKESITKDG
jgi:hypothetical protein